MCPDIMSTGFAGAEAANIRIGDTVVVFAQGPIGLCATAGAKLRGASTIIAVDGIDDRLQISRNMGADITLNFRQVDVVDEIMKITGGRGVDASIEALGTQTTFEAALNDLRSGTARVEARRYVIQPRRLFERSEDSARRLSCRSRR